MDVQTMGLGACLDFIAQDEGWVYDEVQKSWSRKSDPGECAFVMVQHAHPILPTLDSIAGAMPEGWGYLVNHHWLWGKPNVYCEAVSIFGNPPLARIKCEADTELLARARLAVACRMAMKEGT